MYMTYMYVRSSEIHISEYISRIVNTVSDLFNSKYFF